MSDPLIALRRAVAVHHALLRAGIDNAIGGAMSLAYHVDDPRATQDIDVNISLPKDRAREALEALPDDVPWGEAAVAAISQDGQVRIMWPVDGGVAMPLDLFFAEHDLHERARERAVEVPMLGETVRVLSATDLTIFKALFDRTKDWADIEAMLEAHDASVDLDDVIAWVSAIVGERDSRIARLRSLR